jgi:hypothetical protein
MRSTTPSRRSSSSARRAVVRLTPYSSASCASVGMRSLGLTVPSEIMADSVFLFALVRSHPQIPGEITSLVAPGALTGATVGPVLFGLATEAFGYASAWRGTSIVDIVAAGAMLLGNRRLNLIEDASVAGL